MSKFLKEKNPGCKVYLVDPHGSGLHEAVNQAVALSSGIDGSPTYGVAGEVNGKPITWFPRSAGGSITEGIGIDRKTNNLGTSLDAGHIDGAMQATDAEAVDMAYHLLKNEGIFVGPSAAMNVVGAVKLAKKMGPGNTIVTVLCDGGDRYMSKLFNEEWLKEKQLTPAPLDIAAL
jgi:cysteine synthase A